MSSLYLDHFGLTKPPFQITPDLDFFFSGGRRGDILTALLHVGAHDEGITTLVAEVGSGKTLLARLMISRLAPEVCVAYLANPCFSRDEIIVAIARDLGLASLQGSIESKLAALQQELLRRHAGGQRVLLVIDEAHAMPAESLEEVRLLSNLETGQHKLINIMLFGQPELDTLLAEPRLRQVRDRVIHRFELPSLQTSEVSAYIDHRLRAAGWQGAGLFSAAAMARLVKASDGRARRINLLADKALLAAYAQGGHSVEATHVDSAVQELPRSSATPSVTRGLNWRLVGWSFALAGVMTVAAVGLLGWGRSVMPLLAPVAQSVPAPPVPTPPPSVEAQAVTPPPVAPASAVARAMPTAVPQVKKSAEPATTHLDAALARTQVWLQRPDLSGYTIQLAALPSSEGADRYLGMIAAQLDASKIFAHYSVYKGITYMSVYSGHFGTAEAAAVALKALPAALTRNGPLVRSWIKIKQEQTP